VKKALVILAAGAFALMVSSRAFAHHAGGAYDTEHPVTLTGTVTDYKLVNPHTEIHFDVKDANGKVTSWVALSGPPQRLYRAGWRSDTLKPGDQVTVTGAPLKDGRKFMGVQKVIGPTGKVLGAEGE
jgi:DNA/RNA endonuclease YhcR with UshA esterase domain